MFRFVIFSAILSLFLFPLANFVFAAVYPNDMDISKQWYLDKIGAYETWAYTKGSTEVIVAVLDTGVDIDHPDLAFNIWRNKDEIIDGKDSDGNIYVDDINGWDFVDGDSDPRPDLSDPQASQAAIHHGTLVAGIIGAMGDNSLAGAGINWRVKIMPLRVLDSRGQGDTSKVEEAIRYAIDKGAHIINLSFIGPGFDKNLFLALRDAYRAGILVTAAVGNQTYEGIDLEHSPLYPVCYTGSAGEDIVLGVAAVDENDKKPAFSNYGKSCVDLVAPGVGINSTMVYKPEQGYGQMFGGAWQGTSLAAPIVSGAAALIKAVNMNLRAAEIRNILLATADSIPNSNFQDKLGAGRINLKKALGAAVSGVLPSSPYVPGLSYLLVAPSSNALSQVKVLYQDGRESGNFFAYDKNFLKGFKVSSGDIDGDGRAEIITGAGPGGGPHIRIFKADGALLGGFFAYDKSFRGGVNVAVGDIDGDGRAEIITGAGKGGDPEVRVFTASGKHVLSFQAFPNNIRTGVNVAFGKIDDSQEGKIIVSLMNGGDPEVRIFKSSGSWQRAFMAYNDKFRGGVNVAVGDIDGDGRAEIITGAGPGGGPHLIIFDGYGRTKNQFFPLDRSFRGGISVGIISL